MDPKFAQKFAEVRRRMSYKRLFVFLLATALLTMLLGGIMLQMNSTRTNIKLQKGNPTATLQNLGRINLTSGNDISSSQNLCPMLKTGAKPIGSRIPKIFHQTYKSSMLPTAYRQYVAKCRILNPDWLYFLWRDEDIEAFMADHFPQYIRMYKRLTLNVQRADFIRYMVLHHYGGIYLDMDVECVKPFFPNLESHVAFLDQERKEHSHILYNVEFMAMNSVMGSVVGHPYYISMLESINSVSDSTPGEGIPTGPDRLTLVYREWMKHPGCMSAYPVTLLEPEIFSPIADVKLQNFNARCASEQKDKWRKVGCQLLKVKNWRVDATDNRTVGKHHFLHLGYSWGPKSPSFFDAKELGPLKLYKVDRMRS